MWGVEAEGAGGDGTVEGEGCACDCAGAEGAEVHALAGVGEAAGVALDHADVGEEPVGYEDRLGALEVSVGGHGRFACGFGEVDEGFAPCGEAFEGGVDGFADEEAHVGGDLLVADCGRCGVLGRGRRFVWLVRVRRSGGRLRPGGWR